MAFTAVVTLVTQAIQIALNAVVATNTVTINGQVYTAVNGAPTRSSHQFQANLGTDTQTAADLATTINAYPPTGVKSGGFAAVANGPYLAVGGSIVSFSATATRFVVTNLAATQRPFTALVTITSGGGDAAANVNTLQLYATPTSSSMIIGEPPITPGQNVSVPGAGGTLTIPIGMVSPSPILGPNPSVAPPAGSTPMGEQAFTVQANIGLSNGAQIVATGANLIVAGPSSPWLADQQANA